MNSVSTFAAMSWTRRSSPGAGPLEQARPIENTQEASAGPVDQQPVADGGSVLRSALHGQAGRDRGLDPLSRDGHPSTMHRHDADRLAAAALLGGNLLGEEGSPTELRESEIGRHHRRVSQLTIRPTDPDPARPAQPPACPPWPAPSSWPRRPWSSRARGARSRNSVCVVCRSLRNSGSHSSETLNPRTLAPATLIRRSRPDSRVAGKCTFGLTFSLAHNQR